jgi:hypothetical protein
MVRVAAALVCVLIGHSVSHAYFLDDQRRFDVRMRAYSQWSVMTQSSEHKGCITDGKRTPGTCPPSYQGGDLNQIRNFYNPEFDAKLTDFTSWMDQTSSLSWLSPEDFRFRFAWWGFYDYGVSVSSAGRLHPIPALENWFGCRVGNFRRIASFTALARFVDSS